jgi:hypothetical protein
VSRRLSTLHMLRTRVRTKSHGPRRCSRVYSADVLSTAWACCLQHGRLFHSAIVMCALFPRPTWPEVRRKGDSISIRRFISSRLLARDDVTCPCLLFFFLSPFESGVGSKDQRIQRMMIGVENLSQRGMEGYLMDGPMDYWMG